MNSIVEFSASLKMEMRVFFLFIYNNYDRFEEE